MIKKRAELFCETYNKTIQ